MLEPPSYIADSLGLKSKSHRFPFEKSTVIQKTMMRAYIVVVSNFRVRNTDGQG